MAAKRRELLGSEVLATHARVIVALRAEGYDKFIVWGKVEEGGEQLPTERAEPGTRIGVLLKVLRGTRAARARVLRKREMARVAANGEHVYQVLDDSLRDKAHAEMKAAIASLNRAQTYLEQCAVNVERDAAGRSVHPPRERTKAAAVAGVIALLEHVLHDSCTFEGAVDMSTLAEWDEFLSESAVDMHEVGFTDREISRSLTNLDDLDAVQAMAQRRRRSIKKKR
jgi:hypothetical protein